MYVVYFMTFGRDQQKYWSTLFEYGDPEDSIPYLSSVHIPNECVMLIPNMNQEELD